MSVLYILGMQTRSPVAEHAEKRVVPEGHAPEHAAGADMEGYVSEAIKEKASKRGAPLDKGEGIKKGCALAGFSQAVWQQRASCDEGGRQQTGVRLCRILPQANIARHIYKPNNKMATGCDQDAPIIKHTLADRVGERGAGSSLELGPQRASGAS